MISVPQWFFKITGIREKLLQENEDVFWVPAWMKERMKNWLEQLGDWPVSRARYWGAPLPIWVCEKCGNRKVLGSVKELEKETRKKIVEVHKPEIDEIAVKCRCSGTMKRVPEVLDVWFDSGVSSWGALGYPKNKKLFKEFWPADFNLEGTDQFRGWWNSQLICSEISFGKKPFKAVAVHGIVLDLDKIKMSKSMGNIVQPNDVIEKYNIDYLRYYLVGTSKGEDFSFDWEAFKDIHKFFNILWNTFNFAELYLELQPERHSHCHSACSHLQAPSQGKESRTANEPSLSCFASVSDTRQENLCLRNTGTPEQLRADLP
jgi:isoleucyl-tRNA synthetase